MSEIIFSKLHRGQLNEMAERMAAEIERLTDTKRWIEYDRVGLEIEKEDLEEQLAAKDKRIKELEDALELYKDSRERGAIQYEKLEEQLAAKDKELAALKEQMPVRCCECKNHDRIARVCLTSGILWTCYDDDYCSRGVRRQQ